MKEIMGAVLMLGLIVWVIIDFQAMQTVVVVLFERFVQLVGALSDVAESAVTGS